MTDVDHRPWSRYDGTLCKHRDMFYLFGGTVVQDGRKTNSLYCLSLNTMEWRLIDTKGARPPARSGHCAVIDPDTDRMVVFGGRSQVRVLAARAPGGVLPSAPPPPPASMGSGRVRVERVQEKRRLNDVWVLDLATFTWFRQACEKGAPAPRDHATAVHCQGHMVIFGGHAPGKRLNDLAVLDLSGFTWSTWVSIVGQPPPRESAALCVGHGNLLFLHGGCSNFGMDDLWVYDQKHQSWTEITCTGPAPAVRRGHQMFVHDSDLYLFGGLDDLGAPAASMFKLPVEYGTNFATAKLEWRELVSERVFNRNRCARPSAQCTPCERAATQLLVRHSNSRSGVTG